MKLPNLTPEEQKKFENGVIMVGGQAMNRTALGIIAAYFKLYPNATFKDLKEAFPDSLIPTGQRQPKSIFKPYSERDFGIVHSLEEIMRDFAKANLPYEGLFFLEKDEIFKTADGVSVVVKKSWASKNIETGKNELEILANRAKEFGIVINKFEERKHFKKGEYVLQILDKPLFEKMSSSSVKTEEKEVIREKTIEKKVIPFWVWIILGLAAIPFILWALGVFKSEPEIIERETIVEKEIIKTVVDTVFIEQVAEIETSFNAVQFKQGKSDLPEDAKFPLYDLSRLMENNPNLNLKIEGHTSAEGDPDFNQKLSEARAKAVVDFLIERGVDKYRLQYEGKGSAEPIDENNLDINRRTEFIIIE